jgi:hypothetical protein
VPKEVDVSDRWKISAYHSKKFVAAVVAKDQARKRAELLFDLANLRDDGCGRFRRRFGNLYRLPGDDSLLLKYRGELQRIWSARSSPPPEHSAKSGQIVTEGNLTIKLFDVGNHNEGLVLEDWVHQAVRSNEPSWVLTVFSDGLHGVRPNYDVFPLSLAIGATELAPKMALCANPECPARYFLKERKSQRFCDWPACLAYGQREHKRNWWNKHRREWKAKRESLRKRKSKDKANRNGRRKREAERKRRGKHAKTKKA